jgi:predicted RNase H-like nuclease
VIGVDGTNGGWIVAARASGTIACWRIARFDELFLESARPRVVAIDIPIGLPDHGSRACDLEARKLLGQPRGSSVFPAPTRTLLAQKSYPGKGISKQAWMLKPKIEEADLLLRRTAAARVVTHEVHPELCFFYMNGRAPMEHAKRKPAGEAERLALLRDWCGGAIDQALERVRLRQLKGQRDDVIDAFAALWTAERIAEGKAVTHPANPELDAHGLAMSITA